MSRRWKYAVRDLTKVVEWAVEDTPLGIEQKLSNEPLNESHKGKANILGQKPLKATANKNRWTLNMLLKVSIFLTLVLHHEHKLLNEWQNKSVDWRVIETIAA